MPVSEMHRKRRTRNYVVAGILVGLVVLFFAISIAKMSGSAP
ncbi:hypothetical protein [Zavarzinia sp. CC-PAN008]